MNAGNIDNGNKGDGANESKKSEKPEPETSQEAIMQATYRALCNCGAADFTIQAVADEFAKSKSLIFYHYDTREDLLSAFLVYLIDRFEEQVAETDIEDADEELDGLIDALLFGPDDNEDFQTAMFELRSQAPFNETYREQFRTNRSHTHELFEGVIERGIEDGVFTEVDASRIATLILTTIDGARTQLVVYGDDEILGSGRELIDAQLAVVLFAAGEDGK